MHVQTHILAGWCVANVFPWLSPRQRLFCMVVSVAPDVDGLSILGGNEVYWDWHHTAGHNLPVGLAVAALLAAFSRARRAWVLTFLLYLGLFHLHLAMDFCGSGPGWPIHYLWPLHHVWSRARWVWLNHDAWEFYSWQNISAAGILLAWTLLIAYRLRRTPLESVMPRLDRELVRRLRREPMASSYAPMGVSKAGSAD